MLLDLIKKKCVYDMETHIEHGGIMSYLNPSGYLKARKEVSIFEKVTFITMDGIFLLRFLKYFKVASCPRVTFDMGSLTPKVFEYAIKHSKSVYFIGTDKVSIQKAVDNIQDQYKDLNIIGYRDGYFQKDERQDILNNIKTLNPDIVICGMGTIAQEKFLIDLLKNGWTGCSFSCGGFLHQTASKIIYYPEFFNKHNIRWLYRMYKEPKVIKRYFVDYTTFVFVFIYDFFKYKQTKNYS